MSRKFWNRLLVNLSLRRLNMDRWVVVYLLVTAMYAFLRPSVFPDPFKNLAVHLGLAAAVWFLPPWLRSRRRFVPRLLGVIYLPLLFPFFYGEMQYMGIIFFDFENSLDPALIRLEEAIFGFQPSLEWSRVWPWAWFHEIMEFAYFTYYFLSASFIYLAFRAGNLTQDDRWHLVRSFVRDLGVTMLICYTMYSLFPAWGPKYFRAGYVDVGGWIFTDIMRHIHNTGAILGAAFPSSHVAASMIPWWYTWKHFPAHRWWMTLIFVLLCMSTVYNRYHYVVDVFAGLILSAAVLFIMHHLGDVAREERRRRA